jgi:GT2 family glycosyltransferase
MTSRPLVSVVLLSYNRPELLDRAIRSVLRQTYEHLEVVVVDNRSDRSAEVATVASRYPQVTLIAHEDNRGFTGGMNSGIGASRGDYVYLTEDDIELEPDCLEILLQYLASHPEVGLVGPVMFNRLDKTIRCAGGYFTLGSTYRMTIVRSIDRPESSERRQPYLVMYLPGAMLMARRVLFERFGGFRDEFFMYVEDVEFCARVLKAGLAIAVVPTAHVTHHEPAPGVSAVIQFHKIKNLATLYLIHAPLTSLPVFAAKYGALGALRAFAAGQGRVHLRAWAWTFLHARRLLAQRSPAPLQCSTQLSGDDR